MATPTARAPLTWNTASDSAARRWYVPTEDVYPIDAAGQIHVPKKPGIGVELDWAAIDRTCANHQVSRA